MAKNDNYMEGIYQRIYWNLHQYIFFVKKSDSPLRTVVTCYNDTILHQETSVQIMKRPLEQFSLYFMHSVGTSNHKLHS